MWVCNTGIDCDDCPGCDSCLENTYEQEEIKMKDYMGMKSPCCGAKLKLRGGNKWACSQCGQEVKE